MSLFAERQGKREKKKRLEEAMGSVPRGCRL